MLKRILTAVILLPLLILVLWLDNTVVMMIALTVVSVLAVGEILIATKYFSNKGIAVVCMVFVAVLPTFLCFNQLIRFFPALSGLFLLIMFVIMLFDHEKVKFQEIALMTFVSFLIPLSLSTIIFMQKDFEHGIFYVVLTFLIAWISDAGAYFIGSAMGKHKMAPKISPKKSWEGFFGGLAFSVVFVIIVGLGYPLFDSLISGETDFSVNVLLLIPLAVVGAVLSVIGDFSASLLKRQCMVKDFGSILPGHGGILDRFDSVLFVAPFLYFVFKFFSPLIIL
ncbi:MAG TPA: phosphatidate cytidylyltransferase [Ruminococcaceae bacterium]|nr:phosphatidate cytidylyltransferase [Oscillospiraceae bacterium]